MPTPFTPPAGQLGNMGGFASGRATPDAELIQLCRESVLLEADYRRLIHIANRGAGDNDPAALAAEQKSGAQWDKLEKIASIPARTPEGLRAKAKAVHAFFEPDYPQRGTAAGRALWSLVCDVAWRGA